MIKMFVCNGNVLKHYPSLQTNYSFTYLDIIVTIYTHLCITREFA